MAAIAPRRYISYKIKFSRARGALLTLTSRRFVIIGAFRIVLNGRRFKPVSVAKIMEGCWRFPCQMFLMANTHWPRRLSVKLSAAPTSGGRAAAKCPCRKVQEAIAAGTPARRPPLRAAQPLVMRAAQGIVHAKAARESLAAQPAGECVRQIKVSNIAHLFSMRTNGLS